MFSCYNDMHSSQKTCDKNGTVDTEREEIGKRERKRKRKREREREEERERL